MTQSSPPSLSRQYLLGRLDEAATEQIQARLLDDDELCAELQEAEDDLLDDWAHGRLDAGERAGFEERFLASAHGRSRAAFAMALARRATGVPRTGPSRGMLLALAACLVLGFSSLWLTAQNEALRRRAAGSGVARESPVETTPLVASLTLHSDTTRGAATLPQLAAPASAEFVRLTLRIEPAEPYTQYAATVSAAGSRVWEHDRLNAAGSGSERAVTLWLPAAVLPKGRIEVRLDGIEAARRDPVAFYEFTAN